jgi:CRISPR-associated protein Csm4
VEAQGIYRLRLTSPLHLGERGIGMEEAGETVPSDTLFSALCWGLREAEGTGWLEELLDSFRRGPAPFLLTSTFPWAGGVRFLPRPMLPPPDPGDGAGAAEPPAAPSRKRLKGVAFISEGIFRRWLAGESLVGQMAEANFLSGGRLWVSTDERAGLPHGLRDVWASGDPAPHVALDRVTAASTLYHVGELRYREGCGLWFGVRWREPGWREPVEAALSCLGEAGIGGERSTGRGQFRWEPREVEDLPAPGEGARRAVTLSLYHPTRGEVEGGSLDGASYRLRLRRGWVGSPGGQGWRGKAVRMLAEGSVIGADAAGNLADVTPEGFTTHAVYRYGLAFPVGLGVQKDG